MPARCCVPGCKSNYDSTVKTEGLKSIFRFPKDNALKQKWVESISRHDWSPTKYSCVCELHFYPDEVVKLDKYLLPDGTLTMIDCKSKLKENAVPSIFPNLPDYPTKRKASITKEPECKRQNQTQQHEKSRIANFEDFISNFSKNIIISESWNKQVLTSKVIFYTLNLEDELIKIKSQISINDDLVKIFENGYQVNYNKLQWILDSDNMKIKKWSQVQELLDKFK